ncbi:ABC transporter substrate-binding protein [Salinarchaeum chitinilyticum]
MPTRRQFMTTAGTGIAAAVAGCAGDGGSGSGGEMEIMIAWSGGDGATAFEAMHDGFTDEYPDVATTINNNPGGAGTGLATALDTRMFNEDPPSTWGFFTGPQLQPFVDGGLMGSITEDVWEEEGLTEVVPEYLQQMCEFESTGYVAVPLEFNRLNNLFYNVDVVEEAGVDPTSISSPTELIDAMDTIESETDANGLATSTQGTWVVLQLWESIYVGENGYDSYQSFLEGNVAENEADVKAALEVLAEYRSYWNDDAASVNFSEAISDFMGGEAAFLNQGAWAVGNFSQSDEFNYDTHWQSTPIPGTDDVFMGQNSGFMYPEPQPTPEATKQWLRYVGSKEAQVRFNAIKGGVPCRNDIEMDGSGEYTFNGYQQTQYEEFLAAQNLTGTIAHNNEVLPQIASNVSGVFSTFKSNWNVDQAYNGLVDAFDV